MNTANKIVIPEGNIKHLFDLNEIKFIKADRYYVNVICENKKILVRITLKKLEQLLPFYFVRISKSVIINMEKVIRIQESKSNCSVFLKGEIQHQVTEKHKSLFDSYFIQK